ncbi:hypothetical protein PIB30_071505 [Stylosanthes scabra]|uniref:Uncharacterized protein n=1 Tax=Stylosanthes scabra TaxID=79078 RepID=A0ABU6VR96_9FABA|nr:hypothetical protein [Stylosanthes scabra]
MRVRVNESNGGCGWWFLPSGGHNFHTGAPIDAPSAATRSLFNPLRFYTKYEVLNLGAWTLKDAMEIAYER